MVNPGVQDDDPLQSSLLRDRERIEIKAVVAKKDGSLLSESQMQLKIKIEQNWLNLSFQKVK